MIHNNERARARLSLSINTSCCCVGLSLCRVFSSLCILPPNMYTVYYYTTSIRRSSTSLHNDQVESVWWPIKTASLLHMLRACISSRGFLALCAPFRTTSVKWEQAGTHLTAARKLVENKTKKKSASFISFKGYIVKKKTDWTVPENRFTLFDRPLVYIGKWGWENVITLYVQLFFLANVSLSLSLL